MSVAEPVHPYQLTNVLQAIYKIVSNKFNKIQRGWDLKFHKQNFIEEQECQFSSFFKEIR